MGEGPLIKNVSKNRYFATFLFATFLFMTQLHFYFYHIAQKIFN